MSGGDAWATVEPSTNSTIECTTDCGCTTTAMSSGGTSNSRCASISSRPLFTIVAELIVTTGPIDHVGCASACAAVAALRSSSVVPRNGPPEAVSTSRRTSACVPDRSAWAIAECSESTGTSWSCRRCAARTRGPPTTRDSLLASASVLPAPSAASVGPRPTEPVMPLSTTSAPSAATRAAASAPVSTCVPVPSRRSRTAAPAASSATATTGT